MIPNYVARDAALARQAEVIHSLGREKVWKNVLVVCKQSTKPERDGLGAVKAAELLGATEQLPQIVGFRYQSQTELRTEESGDSAGISDEEVTKILKSKLDGFKDFLPLNSDFDKKSQSEEVNNQFNNDYGTDDLEVYQQRKIKTVFGLPPIVLSKAL